MGRRGINFAVFYKGTVFTLDITIEPEDLTANGIYLLYYIESSIIR